MKASNTILQQTKEVETPKSQSEIEGSKNPDMEKYNELCAKWEVKLKAIPRFNCNHYDAKGLLQQKQYFLQAKELMAEFEKTDFPFRICISLESIARDLQLRIFTFPYNFNKAANFLAEELTRTIEECIEFQNSETNQINNPFQKPNIIDNNELLELIHQADELKPLLAENSMQLQSLTNTINKVKKLMANSEMV